MTAPHARVACILGLVSAFWCGQACSKRTHRHRQKTRSKRVAVDPEKSFLFVIGGMNQTGNYSDSYAARISDIFKGNGIRWTRTRPLPEPLQGHTASFCAGQVFVTGGVSRLDKATLNPIMSDKVVQATVRKHEITEWVKAPTLPSPLAYHTAVCHNGFLYVIGGQSPADSDAIQAARIGRKGKLDGWTLAGRLPIPLRGHATVVHRDRLYLLGGHSRRGYTTGVYSTPLRKRGKVGEWRRTTPIPKALVHFAAVEARGRIYMLGGQDREGELYAEVYAAEIQGSNLGEWKKVSMLPKPSARLTATLVGNTLVIAGGGFGWGPPVHPGVYTAKVAKNGSVGKWQKVGDLPRPLAFHTSVVWFR